MDDLAKAILESLLEESVLEGLQRRLKSNHCGGRSAIRFRRNAEGILHLGGLQGLELWLEARLEDGIGLDDELNEIQCIKKNIAHHLNRARCRLLKESKKDQKRKEYESLWLNLLIARDLKKRASEFKFSSDPRQAILKRLQAAGVVA